MDNQVVTITSAVYFTRGWYKGDDEDPYMDGSGGYNTEYISDLDMSDAAAICVADAVTSMHVDKKLVGYRFFTEEPPKLQFSRRVVVEEPLYIQLDDIPRLLGETENLYNRVWLYSQRYIRMYKDVGECCRVRIIPAENE